MALVTNVLFPVDFSPSCVAMAPYVKSVASLFGAKVSLLHVFGPAAHGFGDVFRQNQQTTQQRQDIARDRLNSFLTDEFPVSQYERILTAGDAATEIIHVVENGFDLVVMPMHAGRFKKEFLGSTTAKVLADANCPVLASKHVQTIASHLLEHRECVCALNPDADSERVLRFAHGAAIEAGLNLHIVHSIQLTDPSVPILVEEGEEAPSSRNQIARQRLADLQKRVGSHAPAHFVVGSIKEGLLEIARKVDADVLMIGRRPQAGHEGVDLNYSIANDSPCPLMSI